MLSEKMRESLDSGIAEGDSELHGKKDIMSILVRARISETEGQYKMSDEAMMNQVLTFLGAGHETTGRYYLLPLFLVSGLTCTLMITLASGLAWVRLWFL